MLRGCGVRSLRFALFRINDVLIYEVPYHAKARNVRQAF